MIDSLVIDDDVNSWSQYVSAGACLEKSLEPQFSGLATNVVSSPHTSLGREFIDRVVAHQSDQLFRHIGPSLATAIQEFDQQSVTLRRTTFEMLLDLRFSDLGFYAEPSLRNGSMRDSIARKLVADTSAISGSPLPIIYSAPNNEVVVDFFHEENRLTLFIDDEHCILTSTIGDQIDQETVSIFSDELRSLASDKLTKLTTG